MDTEKQKDNHSSFLHFWIFVFLAGALSLFLFYKDQGNGSVKAQTTFNCQSIQTNNSGVVFCEDFEDSSLNNGNNYTPGVESSGDGWADKYGPGTDNCIDTSQPSGQSLRDEGMEGTQPWSCINVVQNNNCEGVDGNQQCVFQGNSSLMFRYVPNNTGGPGGGKSWTQSRNFGITMAVKWSNNYVTPNELGISGAKTDEWGNSASCILGCSSQNAGVGQDDAPFAGTLKPLASNPGGTAVVGTKEWDGSSGFRFAPSSSSYTFKKGQWQCLRFQAENWGLSNGRIRYWLDDALLVDIQNLNIVYASPYQNDSGGLNSIYWNAYYNGLNGGDSGYAGPSLAGRFEDNIVVTNGAPVSCASIGFSGSSTQNNPPTISVSAPTTATVGNPVSISASASDSDGYVSSVWFRVNGVNQGSADTSSPYGISWSPISAGSYTITALATDNNGASTVSNSITVNVTSNTPIDTTPPVINISAAPSSPQPQGTSVTLTATANEPLSSGGVSFYNNSSLLGSDSSSPYNYTFTTPSAGNYSFSARASDQAGNQGSSNSLSYTISSSICGNGVINSGEQCDGSNLGGQSCSTQGFAGGNLLCSSSCSFVTSQCSLGGGGAFGNTSIGSQTDSQDRNYINAARFTTSSSAGQTQSMSVYVASPVDSSPNNQYSMAIYSDSNNAPGSLIANTQNGTLVANSWNTLPISTNLSSGTTYWLAYNTNAASGSSNNFKYTANSGLTVWRSQTFGFWPSSWSGSEGSSVSSPSIYVTFLTSSPSYINSLSIAPPSLETGLSIIGRSFSLSFHLPGQSTSISSVSVTGGSSPSSFSPSNLLAGSYDVSIKTNKYLSRRKQNLSLQNNYSISSFLSLYAGDLNNDNIINSLDWSLMNNAWFQNSPANDLNEDGLINSLDRALLVRNWFRVGE